jgi:hypothetical protein
VCTKIKILIFRNVNEEINKNKNSVK